MLSFHGHNSPKAEHLRDHYFDLPAASPLPAHGQRRTLHRNALSASRERPLPTPRLRRNARPHPRSHHSGHRPINSQSACSTSKADTPSQYANNLLERSGTADTTTIASGTRTTSEINSSTSQATPSANSTETTPTSTPGTPTASIQCRTTCSYSPTRHAPRAKAPFPEDKERAKPKGLAYPEATTRMDMRVALLPIATPRPEPPQSPEYPALTSVPR